ncbi:MAG: hypothetical protein K8F91_20895, partial [Candidatus Obscuribacterales bacterium]|nr:hypothetical protein [Candidatus Obscuribacterales bacterium]
TLAFAAGFSDFFSFARAIGAFSPVNEESSSIFLTRQSIRLKAPNNRHFIEKAIAACRISSHCDLNLVLS